MLILWLHNILNMPASNIQPEEGDIFMFWHNPAQKEKYAINLEPKRMHKNKNTFNGVITTTQNVDQIYPGDYLLPDNTLSEKTKVICDQLQAIPKSSTSHKIGQVKKEDLQEIRKRAAASLGINYTGSTL